MNWDELFAPLKAGMDQTFVTWFRDPALGLALAFALLSVALVLVYVLALPRRAIRWLLGKSVALGAFFGISGAALCLVPHDRGMIFTRVQAGAAAALVAVCIAFVIVVFRRTRH